ncbi:MAG: hypothetical protein LBI05_02675 [Planctomycetaceae bacterium]|nr:hypothetical protein [Planctomycetaceae bacterium]
MKTPYRLSCCAIFFIVLLRIGIGWHFFYEGVHKFDPAAGFSAEGFLGVAKGPTADLYYWMLPDLDGIQRIEIGKVEDENGKEHTTFIVYENAWKEYYNAYLKQYPKVSKEEADAIYNRYLKALRAGATDSEPDIKAFLQSRDRFRETKRTQRNSASFEQERRWNLMLQYRREASTWTKVLSELSNGLQSDLGRLADPDLAGQKGEIVTAPEKELIPPIPPNDYFNVQIQYPIPSNPYVKSRMDVLDLAVMVGLSAIGLCMMIGFCTRLACLGGAAFLVNVVLTTFPVPGVYPELPTMVGNFLFVSKDVVELLAMLVLMSVPSGRWGGFDYFLWNYGGKQICGLFCPCCRDKGE